ncbi:MAG: DUF2953 domain-containing protein [Lachnospiraceae bacterium]|nr:DUF2953 domain-containing protein [Lachnospiraceae bacterium]
MTVFLTVLKITGIVLLSVLALAIILILLLLFYPFRYRIEAVADSVEGRYDASFHLTYLYRVLHGKALWDPEGGLIYDLKLFWVKIWPKDDEEEEEEFPEMADWEDEDFEVPEPEEEFEAPEPETAEPEEEFETPEPEIAEPEEDFEMPEPEAAEPETPEEEAEPGFFRKLKEFPGFIKQSFSRAGKTLKKFGYTIKRPYDTIKKLIRRVQYFRKLWGLESSARARALLIKETKRLLKNLRPRKFLIEGTFGFDSPADTGELLGLIRAFGGYPSKKVRIFPDFDREVLKGRMLLKGNMQLYVVGIVAWKFYYDKDLKKFVRRVKTGLER